MNKARAWTGVITISGCLSVAASDLRSQEHERVEGTRVRIRAPLVAPKRLVGTLRHASTDALTLELGGEALVVPRRSIDQIQVSRGHRRNAVQGALIGAAAMSLWVAASGDPCDRRKPPPRNPPTFGFDVSGLCLFPPDFKTRVLPVMAAAGAGIGAGVGALVKTERWNTISPDRVRVSVAPLRRGFGAQVSIGF